MIPEFGVFSLIYKVLTDLFNFIWRRTRKRTLSASQVIELRSKWKAEFEEKILARRKQGLRTDIYIRDMARIDEYPDCKTKKGKISPWFRVGLMGTYHKGLLLGLGWYGLVLDQKTQKYRERDHKTKEDASLTTILIGYVPYEYIESVDWDGDEITGLPHLYCHFSARSGEPYERLAYCERKELDGFPYYVEVSDYFVTRKESKKAGIK